MAYRDKDKEVAAKRRSYEKHREVVKERTRLRRQRLRDDNREKLEALLRASECTDCGETDWVVLEFDQFWSLITSQTTRASASHRR